MRTILRIKHWQIFLFYLILSFLSTKDYDLPKSMDELLKVSPLLFLIAWNLLLGFVLQSIKPKNLKFNTSPAILAAILTIFLIIITITTTDGMYDSIFLNIVLGLLIIIPFFVIAAFPAELLKSLELDRKAKPIEYGNYIFEFLILIIGVWLYQPRINKIEKIKNN
jgi:branched-subunit amino acid transport protein